MKRIIKESTTITEMIVDDNGKVFIIDRKYIIEHNSQLITDIITNEVWEEWKKLDRVYRQEIAEEAEDYKKKNPFPETKKE